MDYIKRLKEIKNQKKMTNEKLAELTEIPGGTLAKILAGISESPKLANFVSICEALGCSLDYAYYGAEENTNNFTLSEEEIAMVERYRELDHRGREVVEALVRKESEWKRPALAADAPASVPRPRRLPEHRAARPSRIRLPLYDLPVSAGFGEELDGDSSEEIVVNNTETARGADFALRISGNSMEPRYHDGDILLVEETDTLEYGDLGIFVLDGNGYFKVFGGDRLHSLNHDYGDILLKDFSDTRVVGRVIGRLHKRRPAMSGQAALQ